ncbi:MAG: alpha/beta fold hydrolase [Candidatus Saccharimonadales bacterium]|jgi:pimeloyl-ACP methyl ester carboxylesterase
MQEVFDRLWHQVLGRPYQAVCTVDEGTGDPPVVLLHGLGSSSKVWSNVVTLIKATHRVIALDLVGFGESPKPSWLAYSVDDHARAVIASLKKQRIKRPIILVGHSMGCLVAVRVARMQPKLVKRLVLYEMPLYTDVPALKRYTLMRRLYFRAYSQVVKHPEYSPTNVHLAQKIAARLSGFAISKQTWIPYAKSLKNTIMKQQTAEDMRRLRVPMDLIYGSLDMVILRGHVQTIFDLEVTKISTHMVRSRHKLTPRASAFIATRIDENIEVPVRKMKIPSSFAKTKLSTAESAQAQQ